MKGSNLWINEAKKHESVLNGKKYQVVRKQQKVK